LSGLIAGLAIAGLAAAYSVAVGFKWHELTLVTLPTMTLIATLITGVCVGLVFPGRRGS
jgi:hypothetical protein